MIEQGYNYLDGLIHCMAEFFETRIGNLEKSIPPSVLSRNRKKSKKGPTNNKSLPFRDSKDKDSKDVHKGKKFCQHHGMCNIPQTGQTSKTEERKTLQEIPKVHQT